MKRIIRSLLVAAGGLALLPILAPTDGWAQCRNSHGHGHGKRYHGGGHHRILRCHVAPRCSTRVYVAPRVVVRHARAIVRPRLSRVYVAPGVISLHSGGPIYYRNSSLYVRPTLRSRSVYVAPGYSRGSSTHVRRRCHRR